MTNYSFEAAQSGSPTEQAPLGDVLYDTYKNKKLKSDCPKTCDSTWGNFGQQASSLGNSKALDKALQEVNDCLKNKLFTDPFHECQNAAFVIFVYKGDRSQEAKNKISEILNSPDVPQIIKNKLKE